MRRHRPQKSVKLKLKPLHLLRVGSPESLLYQLEHIKYIADETNTLHVLFGTYELTKLMDLSSAIIRVSGHPKPAR